MQGETKQVPARTLASLRSVGPVTLKDFRRLGVTSVEDLATRDADVLYGSLCGLAGQRLDPCVHDVFACAIAQAGDPDLPDEQRDWWWWSGVRKAAKA